MDPITIWTALGVIVVIAGSVIGAVRRGDKDGANVRFTNLENKMGQLDTKVDALTQAKLDKEEFNRFVDQNRNGFEEIKDMIEKSEERTLAHMDRLFGLKK